MCVRGCVKNDLTFVYFKCKYELHVCTHIRLLSVVHCRRIHLECTHGLDQSIQMMCMMANKRTETMQVEKKHKHARIVYRKSQPEMEQQRIMTV